MPKSEKKETEKKIGPLCEEELKVAAYFHWRGRGCPLGDPQADWYEVEKKVESEIRSHEKRAASQTGIRRDGREKRIAV